MKKHFIFIAISLLFVNGLSAQQVDYSVVSVPEESGIEFTPITTVSDYL